MGFERQSPVGSGRPRPVRIALVFYFLNTGQVESYTLNQIMNRGFSFGFLFGA